MTNINKDLLSYTLLPQLKNFIKGYTERINTLYKMGDYASYPDPLMNSLKEKYTHHLYREYGAHGITKDNILFTAGCTEGIDICIRGLTGPSNDTIGVCMPTIPLYQYLTERNNRHSENYWLDYSHSSPLLPEGIPSKILFICNPNNPLGFSHTKEDLQRLLESTHKMIIIDETYIDFAKDVSCVPLVSKYNNLVILRSFSKGWGLAGLRMGAIISNSFCIENLQKIQLPFSVNQAAQDNFAKSLDAYPKMQDTLAKVQTQSYTLAKKLENTRHVEKVYRSKTNFIFVTLRNFSNLREKLFQEKAFITDFSHLIPNSLRISVYSPKEDEKILRILNSG